jgi:N-methylhydantoinase B
LALWQDTNVEQLIAQDRSPVNLDEIEGKATELPCCDFEFKKNDVLYMRLAMGGGYGDPLDREPARVAKDLVSGLVSRQAADEVYGVVCRPNGDLDLPATEKRRAALKAGARLEGTRRS